LVDNHNYRNLKKITIFVTDIGVSVHSNRGSDFFLYKLKIKSTMSGINYMTLDGLNKLKKELDHLMKVERPSISKQIGEAIDKGDISENAEYDAAKDAQGMLEARISKIQSKIANARIIDESKIDTSTVQIMNVVTIKNKKTNAIMKYTIVSETEADLKAGKISIETPIAKGLLGKKVGDEVDIKVPSGVIPFEIIDISI
jgi:transcription elongation factor GreA